MMSSRKKKAESIASRIRILCVLEKAMAKISDGD
jgi:hypothetical protein